MYGVRWKLIFLKNDDLIKNCLDQNILISSISCEILVNRTNLETNLSDDILEKVLNKLSIEQIWDLMTRNDNSKLSIFAKKKLDKILEYYQNTIEYYNKVNENNKDKIYVIK